MLDDLDLDDVKKAFLRMNLSDYSHFFLYGTENLTLINQPYAEYMEENCKPIYNRLKRIYADSEEAYENAVGDLALALLSYQQAYMEIGMKAGAKVIYELLLTMDKKKS